MYHIEPEQHRVVIGFQGTRAYLCRVITYTAYLSNTAADHLIGGISGSRWTCLQYVKSNVYTRAGKLIYAYQPL